MHETLQGWGTLVVGACGYNAIDRRPWPKPGGGGGMPEQDMKRRVCIYGRGMGVEGGCVGWDVGWMFGGDEGCKGRWESVGGRE